MHNVLQKAREAMPGERRLIVARDDAYELARRAELLYDDAKNGLDFARARQAEDHAESSRRMAVASHRLNLLVAFFFPIATLMAIFNAKLTHGLEGLDAKYGPWVLVSAIIAGLLLGMLITRIITRPSRRPQNTGANASKRK